MYERNSVLYVKRSILGNIIHLDGSNPPSWTRELEFQGEDGGVLCVVLHARERSALVFEREQDLTQRPLTPDSIPAEREVVL